MKNVLGNVGVAFAVVLTLAFVVFGIRGIYDPTAASIRFVAMLLTAALTLPIFDAVLLYRERGPEAGLTVHIVTGVIVAIAACLMWFKASPAKE
jgi:hypothetical protein